ncbi:MAG TPA: putative glycoside hydrolase [Gemmatimonadaceae bacterium]|nr:putative glycoside hydrolase [Gemmatimonadaceae bacterium]
MRSIPFLVLALTACGAGEAARSPKPTAQTPHPDSVAVAAAPSESTRHAAHATPASHVTPSKSRTPAPALATAAPAPSHGKLPVFQAGDTTPVHRMADPGIVRGLYVNRWAAQSPKRMRELIAIADSTEINALVIDMKDEFGLNFEPTDPLVARNAGNAGHVANLRALIDTLKAHNIMPIARLVTFKDSVTARANPEHTIRTADGSEWKDKKGLTWVNPYDKDVWEYNIRVAEEVARLGFAEIQFDYIRFPEPYKSLPPQVFPGQDGVPKAVALANFFKAACPRIHALGARCTADIFGLVTSIRGALEVGQQWETLSQVTDVLLPMVYPSHYPSGAFGLSHPDSEPYKVIDAAISSARERDTKLGIDDAGHVRPWLQAFTLGSPRYGPAELSEEKRAVYDAGYDGWVMWNPGSEYEIYRPALERETVSRRKVGVAGRQ